LIEAVVFDLGHTLVDFVLNQDLLFAAHMEGLGLLASYLVVEAPDGREQVDDLTHRVKRCIANRRLRQDLHELGVPAVLARLAGDLPPNIPKSLRQQLVGLGYRALSAELHLSPANAQVLRVMRSAGFRLALLSDIVSEGDRTRDLLDDLGLLEQLDVVVLCAEEGIRKPDPRAYQTVLARLGIDGRQAVFVGDRLGEDVAGPQAAGMRAILTRQFRREEPEPTIAMPDGIIDRLADLPVAVDALHDAVGT
jgi:putative hydrolase of the HAD superfamily